MAKKQNGIWEEITPLSTLVQSIYRYCLDDEVIGRIVAEEDDTIEYRALGIEHGMTIQLGLFTTLDRAKACISSWANSRKKEV